MHPKEEQRIQSERRERGKPTERADEYELSPIQPKGQPVARQQTCQETNHKTSGYVDDHSPERKARRQPAHVHEMIDTMTRGRTHSTTNGDSYPHAHTARSF
jgi:hypothetical protein